MDAETGYIFINNTVDRMLFNIFGAIVSLYSLNIEWKKEHNPMYKAYCDINEHMSCSRVLTSEYARGFGLVSILFGKNSSLNIRNCTLGIFFLPVSDNVRFQQQSNCSQHFVLLICPRRCRLCLLGLHPILCSQGRLRRLHNDLLHQWRHFVSELFPQSCSS
ncbi:hypothetical protein CHS0354_011266 [Potamilus streckersoni]|uniref:vitamin-K-epoxide reductase (warfarin-sensitive) n=1 Tax=Potamilus streckersoni TaxID=2493646 RepID=A0AAE0RND4_9BIVA|nr:hypothetical protein CHS0354_011266 [Potamilus streckersoni]